MKHSVRINGEIRVEEFELGSGILDSNGIEIFEGDVVKYVNDDDETDAGKITFHHGRFWVDDDLDLSNLLYDCEVTVVD